MRRSDAATDQRGMDLLRPIVPGPRRARRLARTLRCVRRRRRPGGGQDSATTLPFAARLCAAVALAGAFVIAEGIEDQDTLAFLQHIDTSDPRPETLIQGGQGYGLGRPAPDLPTDAPGLLAALTLPVGR